jgi:hypothetical protein
MLSPLRCSRAASSPSLISRSRGAWRFSNIAASRFIASPCSTRLGNSITSTEGLAAKRQTRQSATRGACSISCIDAVGTAPGARPAGVGAGTGAVSADGGAAEARACAAAGGAGVALSAALCPPIHPGATASAAASNTPSVAETASTVFQPTALPAGSAGAATPGAGAPMRRGASNWRVGSSGGLTTAGGRVRPRPASVNPTRRAVWSMASRVMKPCGRILSAGRCATTCPGHRWGQDGRGPPRPGVAGGERGLRLIKLVIHFELAGGETRSRVGR